MGLTPGNSSLEQVIESTNNNGALVHATVRLKGDAEPYLAMVSDNPNLNGAIQGIVVVPPSPTNPGTGPVTYRYTWTRPDSGLSGVMFPSQDFPLPGPIFPTSGATTLVLTYADSTLGNLASIVLDDRDITQETLGKTNQLRPAFACTQSGLYRLRLSINDEEVVNQSYLQRAPVFEQPLADFSGASINSTVHIQNRIVYDQGPPEDPNIENTTSLLVTVTAQAAAWDDQYYYYIPFRPRADDRDTPDPSTTLGVYRVKLVDLFRPIGLLFRPTSLHR